MPLRYDEKEEVRAIVREEMSKNAVAIDPPTINDISDKECLRLVEWINNYVEKKGGRLVASGVSTKAPPEEKKKKPVETKKETK